MTCDPQAVNVCGSMGVYTAMLVADSNTDCTPVTFSSSAERYEILSENIRYTDTLLGGEGLTGTIDTIGNHLRHGTRIVAGTIVLEVGPYELDHWLPRIFGNPASGTTFATDETFDLQPFDVIIKRDQGVAQYRQCSVSSATFTSTASVSGQGQVMRLTMQIIGHEEHDGGWPATPPALPTAERLYWLLGDGKLEMTPAVGEAGAGTAVEYYFDAFSLRVDNNLVPKTRNFLKVVCIQTNGRKIRLRVRTPYTTASHTNLYINDFKGSGVLSFLGGQANHNNMEVDALYTTVVTLPDLRQTRVTPGTNGRGEIPLSLDLEAYRTATAEPISVVNTHPA
jgi:hypothetical protein